MDQEVNVLALVKGKERYVFLYNAQNRREILDSFGRYASDPELSFNWHDAAVLTQKVRREQKRAELAEIEGVESSGRRRGVRKLEKALGMGAPCGNASRYYGGNVEDR